MHYLLQKEDSYDRNFDEASTTIALYLIELFQFQFAIFVIRYEIEVRSTAVYNEQIKEVARANCSNHSCKMIKAAAD